MKTKGRLDEGLYGLVEGNMVVESSCDEGKRGSGLNVRRNRVRGLVGKHARARLAICPFSASVVPKAARCLYPETKAGETWKKRLSRNHYDYRQSVARGAVVYKRAGVYWSRVHLPSRKSQKRHVQRKETLKQHNTK